MKLHTTVVDRLVHMFETYGGHRNETKLKSMLQQVELSEYQRSGPSGPGTGEKILVMTEDLEAATVEK